MRIQFKQSARVEARAKSEMLSVGIASSRLVHILVMICGANHARWRYVILRGQVTMSREIGPTWTRVFVLAFISDTVCGCYVAVVSPVDMMVVSCFERTSVDVSSSVVGSCSLVFWQWFLVVGPWCWVTGPWLWVAQPWFCVVGITMK